MSFAVEFESLAKLLREAAAQINHGVWGAYADEEKQHPSATVMRRVERQCNRKAAELERLAAAVRTDRRAQHGNRERRRSSTTGASSS
jgi:hypothetical protein